MQSALITIALNFAYFQLIFQWDSVTINVCEISRQANSVVLAVTQLQYVYIYQKQIGLYFSDYY